MFAAVFALLVSFMIIAQPASAGLRRGYEVGNGGFLIQCDSSSTLGKGVYSLDRIEGQALQKIIPSPEIAKLKSEEEILDVVFKKLHTVNAERAALYRGWYQELKAQRVFLQDLALESVRDGSISFVPVGCVAKQAAVFATEEGSSNLKFYFDETLWKQAQALDKAYLVMHELIYREAALPENLHKNSMAARDLNAYLLGSLHILTQENWLKALHQTKFRKAQYQGVQLLLSGRTRHGDIQAAPLQYFAETGKLKKAVMDYSFNITVGGKNYAQTCPAPDLSVTLYTNYVEYYPSGPVKRIVFTAHPGIETVPKCQGIDGKNDLEFDESGNLIRASAVHAPAFTQFEN